jgi:hypothetical protein
VGDWFNSAGGGHEGGQRARYNHDHELGDLSMGWSTEDGLIDKLVLEDEEQDLVAAYSTKDSLTGRG